jgi:peptide-methionine (R)-S-oxide reductase
MKTRFKFSLFILVLVFSASCQNSGTKNTDTKTTLNNQTQKNPFLMDTTKINKTDEEWKEILSPEQYAILRLKGTERPWTGKYNMHFEKGKYVCAGCGYELFTSASKFESHCGWPAFDDEIAKGSITTKVDSSFGMKRTEIMCGKCGGHLGHVFDDGPTKTGVRYCVNSASIEFKEEEKKK